MEPYEPVTLHGATFGIRAGARLIDMAVHYVIWLVGSLFIGLLVGLYAAANHLPVDSFVRKLQSPAWYGFLAAFAGSLLYHAVMEGFSGSTIGKRLLGLKVVNTEGNHIRFPAALIRSAAFFIDGLFFGLVAYSSMNPPWQQRLGDQWAHTVVIKRSSALPISTESSLLFWGALCCGLLVDAGCFLLSMAIKLGT